FFSSRRRHTRFSRDWSSDVCSSDLLKTGTSLSKTIETTTQIEKILIDNFPEVDQVVTRIGAAEVPTDPMSMEESDVIITLRPKRSEERRVGTECRAQWGAGHGTKKR